MQQDREASVYLYWTDPRREMFRPDPDAEHSVEDVIAKLTEVLVGVPHEVHGRLHRADNGDSWNWGDSILDSGFAIIPGENDPSRHGDDQKGVF